MIVKETIKEQFESLIRVLNLQKDRLLLCNLYTEYIDSALEIAVDLENRCGDIVEVPVFENLEGLLNTTQTQPK